MATTNKLSNLRDNFSFDSESRSKQSTNIIYLSSENESTRRTQDGFLFRLPEAAYGVLDLKLAHVSTNYPLATSLPSSAETLKITEGVPVMTGFDGTAYENELYLKGRADPLVFIPSYAIMTITSCVRLGESRVLITFRCAVEGEKHGLLPTTQKTPYVDVALHLAATGQSLRLSDKETFVQTVDLDGGTFSVNSMITLAIDPSELEDTTATLMSTAYDYASVTNYAGATWKLSEKEILDLSPRNNKADASIYAILKRDMRHASIVSIPLSPKTPTGGNLSGLMTYINKTLNGCFPSFTKKPAHPLAAWPVVMIFGVSFGQVTKPIVLRGGVRYTYESFCSEIKRHLNEAFAGDGDTLKPNFEVSLRSSNQNRNDFIIEITASGTFTLHLSSFVDAHWITSLVVAQQISADSIPQLLNTAQSFLGLAEGNFSSTHNTLLGIHAILPINRGLFNTYIMYYTALENSGGNPTLILTVNRAAAIRCSAPTLVDGAKSIFSLKLHEVEYKPTTWWLTDRKTSLAVTITRVTSTTTRSVRTAVYLGVNESGDLLFRGSLGEVSDDTGAIYLVEEMDQQRRCTIIVDKETKPLMHILGLPKTLSSTSSRIIASSPILFNESTHVNLILRVGSEAIGKNIVATASDTGTEALRVLARIPVSSQSTVNYSTMQLVDSDIRISKLTSFEVLFKNDDGETVHIPPSFYLQIGINLQQMINAEALR